MIETRADRKWRLLEEGELFTCSCCSDPPPPPDYSGIAAASEEAAEIQAAVALEQLDWTKEMWADQRATLDEIMEVAMPQMQEQWETAKADRERYEELYQPLEEEYLERAAGWDTPARRDAEAAKIQTEISKQFDAQRKNALQRLESYGVDPSQTRNQALDLGVRIEQAKAMAQGANEARSNVEREGLGMLGESINVGRGLPAQGLQYAASSQAAQNQAAQNAAAWQGASNAMGSPTAWMAGSDRSLGTWGNALTGGYNAQLNAYNAEQANSPLSLLSSGLGVASGLGWSPLGNKGGEFTSYANGGETAIPMEGEYIPAGTEVQGPGGPKDDMIDAKLSDGEFVIPEEVVRRKGTEFFDKLIEKTHKDLAERAQGAQVTPNGTAIPPPTSMPAQPEMAEGGAVWSPWASENPAANRVYGNAIEQSTPIGQWGAPQYRIQDGPAKSDMQQWLAYKKAQRLQKGVNEDAQKRYQQASQRHRVTTGEERGEYLRAKRALEGGWGSAGTQRIVDRYEASIPQKFVPRQVTGAGVERGRAYQQKFDQRIADMRAKLRPRIQAMRANKGEKT
ncbi:MAG: hypothetical protein R3260_03450 [Pseudomonas sp.]|nr:hypothetical protein [Pseudomonas sp.]